MRRIRGTASRRERKRIGEATTGAESQREQLRCQIPDASEFQMEVIASVRELTMTSPERILALCKATEYLCSNRITGDFVECGVWRGGSMAAAAKTLLHCGDADRRLWMYDTFDGMSAPTQHDVDCLGQSAAQLMHEQDPSDGMSVWCRSPLENVKTTMQETGYSVDQIRFVVGKVEETLVNNLPDRIAMLRLDTDWYESTRCELQHLFPRLVPGGVLIVDDYGHWEGCRRAVDEYFQQNQISMLLNRIDYTGRIGVFYPGVTRDEN